MPRDANGNFTRPVSPYQPYTPASATPINTEMDGIAEALTGSLSRSGQGGMLNDLDMGAKRIRNLAPGTEPHNAVRMDQVVQNSGDTLNGTYSLNGSFVVRTSTGAATGAIGLGDQGHVISTDGLYFYTSLPVQATSRESDAYALALRARTDGASVLTFLSSNGAVERARIQSDISGNLDFGTGPVASAKMRLTASGALGVGTTVPGAPLHVRATTSGTALLIQQVSTASPGVQVWYNGTNYNTYTRVEQTTGNFEFVDSTYALVTLQITQGGATYNATGVYGSTSDAELKQDIVDASQQWDDFRRLRFRRYRMKSDVARLGDASPWHLGVIAQETQAVSPGLVEPDADGTLRVKYSILQLKAAATLQEAQRRIEALEARLASLEGANG